MSTAEQGGPAAAEVVTIIRYPNRRLYDKSQGKYITLQDVEDTVRRGRTVVVRDSKTGEDLTSSLLTQIILERHPERMGLFPVTLLHLIIRANEVMFGALRDPVRLSLQYAEMLQRAGSFNPLALPQEWVRAFLPGLPSRDQPDLGGLGGLGGASALPAAEVPVDGLLRRIAELERRLDDLGGLPAPDEAPGPNTTSRKRKPGRKG
jgi:polyhydroxyalkanoate synthesis repressor PhaR